MGCIPPPFLFLQVPVQPAVFLLLQPECSAPGEDKLNSRIRVGHGSKGLFSQKNRFIFPLFFRVFPWLLPQEAVSCQLSHLPLYETLAMMALNTCQPFPQREVERSRPNPGQKQRHGPSTAFLRWHNNEPTLPICRSLMALLVLYSWAQRLPVCPKVGPGWGILFTFVPVHLHVQITDEIECRISYWLG